MNNRLRLMLLTLVMVLGAFSTVAAAEIGATPEFPAGSEKNVWYIPWDWNLPTNAELNLNSISGWVQLQAPYSVTAPARTFNSGNDFQPLTNQAVTGSEFTQHASVAQWIKWSIDGTRKDWFVRQPGLYYSDGIKFKAYSNDDVLVSFAGFGDLVDPNATPGTQQAIETWYSLDRGDVPGQEGWGPANWIRAGSLNSATLYDSSDLHYGKDFEIWTAIQVEPSNSAGEYENTGTITFTLSNVKAWINPVDGYFGSAR